MNCPNKNTIEWKTLIEKLGEEGAYKMYIAMGEDLPPLSAINFILSNMIIPDKIIDVVRYNENEEVLAPNGNVSKLYKNIESIVKEQDNIPKVILPIGTSGSGKSTWIESININNQYEIIEPDSMRVEFTGDMNNKSKDKEIYIEAANRAVRALKEGKSVMFDTTNLTKDKRLPFVEAIKKELPNANIQYKTLPLNPELAKARIKAQIERGENRANVSDATIDRHAESYKQMLIDIKDEPITEYTDIKEQVLRFYKQTRSKEFKEWFGDSKVVDENGEPLIVYHGSSNKDINEFKKDKIGTNTDDGFAGRGFYFDREFKNADLYKYDFDNNEGIVYPVFLKIGNLENWNDLKPISEQQKADGYNFRRTEIVVFESNQIKSVFNQGTFSKDNTNIYDQVEQDKIYIEETKQVALHELQGYPSIQYKLDYLREFEPDYGELDIQGETLTHQCK